MVKWIGKGKQLAVTPCENLRSIEATTIGFWRWVPEVFLKRTGGYKLLLFAQEYPVRKCDVHVCNANINNIHFAYAGSNIKLHTKVCQL